MNGFIEKYTDKLIAKEIIKSEDKDLYTYGFQQGLIILANILTTILIGFIFGMIWQSVVFMMAYIPLRSFAGGFHAKTPIRCYLYSIVLTSAVLSAVKFIPWSDFMVIGLALVAGIIIFLLAPVADSNKPLDQNEVVVYKKRSRLILVLEVGILMLLLLIGIKNIPSVISVSLLALSVMLIMGKLNRS